MVKWNVYLNSSLNDVSYTQGYLKSKFFLARASSRPSWVGRRSGNLNILTFWVEARMPANISYILVMKHVPACTNNLCSVSILCSKEKEHQQYHACNCQILADSSWVKRCHKDGPVNFIVSFTLFKLLLPNYL